MCTHKVEEQCFWTCISLKELRQAFSKWTDEYLLRLWGKRRVIDVEIKKDPDSLWLVHPDMACPACYSHCVENQFGFYTTLSQTPRDMNQNHYYNSNPHEHTLFLRLKYASKRYINMWFSTSQPTQVEERGGPSEQWPFEKFVREMHKARRGEDGWSTGMKGMVEMVQSMGERDWIDGLIIDSIMDLMIKSCQFK